MVQNANTDYPVCKVALRHMRYQSGCLVCFLQVTLCVRFPGGRLYARQSVAAIQTPAVLTGNVLIAPLLSHSSLSHNNHTGPHPSNAMEPETTDSTDGKQQ